MNSFPPFLGRYSLQGDTKKYFSIGKYSGELKTVQALDREENSTYTMKVIAVDGSEGALLHYDVENCTMFCALTVLCDVTKGTDSSSRLPKSSLSVSLTFQRTVKVGLGLKNPLRTVEPLENLYCFSLGTRWSCLGLKTQTIQLVL